MDTCITKIKPWLIAIYWECIQRYWVQSKNNIRCRRQIRRSSTCAFPWPWSMTLTPPNYMVNALGQQFLIYDNQWQDRILFSTPESLRFFANADNWFMGGTFKFSPLQFTQLYTIHGFSSGRNVVGAYALLPDKRTVTYAEMLTQIQRLMNNVVP